MLYFRQNSSKESSVNSGKVSSPILRFVYFQAAVLVLALVPSTSAQDPAVNVADDRGTPSELPGEQLPANLTNAQSRKLSIGPGDELDVSVYGVPELSQHVRVDTSGDVH